MIGAYLTESVVFGIAISCVGLIHYSWLRKVFREPSEADDPQTPKTQRNQTSRPSINLPASPSTRPKLNRKRIIILGGGFAGVKCAHTLSRELAGEHTEVVLFNAENHLVFTPLLADVVGASVNPLDVVVPLRQLLAGVHCRTE